MKTVLELWQRMSRCDVSRREMGEESTPRSIGNAWPQALGCQRREEERSGTGREPQVNRASVKEKPNP